MKKRLSVFAKMLSVTALMAFAAAPGALAQDQLPAGIGGYWKIVKMYPKKPVAAPGCSAAPSFFSKAAQKTRVLLSDRNIVWGATSATDPLARVRLLTPADFAARYGQGGATLDELEMNRSAKIEVIELSAPGTLPFDAIVVKDPSTLYFEHCGLFMQAVHDSGFVAPPLPNRDQ